MPDSTRPGCVRQVGWVEVGISVVGVGVRVEDGVVVGE